MKGFSRLHKVGEYWQLRHIEQYWRETLKHVVVYALWLGTFFRKFYVKAAAQAKFAEIDADDSGELEGEEIDDLLDWIFQYVQHDDGTPLSAIDRAAERYHFKRRLDPDDDGSITFDELHTYIFGVVRAVLSMERRQAELKHRHLLLAVSALQAAYRGRRSCNVLNR